MACLRPSRPHPTSTLSRERLPAANVHPIDICVSHSYLIPSPGRAARIPFHPDYFSPSTRKNRATREARLIRNETLDKISHVENLESAPVRTHTDREQLRDFGVSSEISEDRQRCNAQSFLAA